MAAQQLRLSFHKLVVDGLDQLIGDELEDDRLQSEGRLLCGALDQHTSAQRFERRQDLTMRHALTDIGQQGAEWHKFALDGQPAENRLLERRRARKLRLEQRADTVEERLPGRQK